MKNWLDALIDIAEGTLRGYGAVFFSRKIGVSVVLLAATLIEPVEGLGALACAALATAMARGLGYDRTAVSRGFYTFNAVLVGLAVMHRHGASPEAPLLLIAGALLAVLATATLQSVFENVFNLPQVSLGFVLVTVLVYAGSGHAIEPYEPSPLLATLGLPASIEAFLGAVGSVFFRSDPVAGLFVFAGLLYSSRIAAVLAAIGFAAGSILPAGSLLSLPGGMDYAGLNAILVAIAVGGIYSVPSLASYAMAALAALLTTPVSRGFESLLSPFGVELLSLPFLAVLWATVAALRMRPLNAGPELVFLPAPSPEDNLAVAQARRLRAKEGAALRLPFIGPWQVLQGADGPHTHIGRWRHALDFAVPEGGEAYGLPLTSPQAGVVSKIVDGIPDNQPGAMDIEHNWGNYVSIRHVDGSFSLLAHIKQGSIRVRPGDHVEAGQVLALCGNSGRSPAPHLHYHVQKVAEPGGDTLPFAFASYIRLNGDKEFVENALPQVGEVIESPVVSPRLRAAFDLTTGDKYVFDVQRRALRYQETLTCAMDLYGWRYLETDRDRSRLYYRLTEDMFYFDYCSAKPGTLLFALRLAASKVPLSDKPGLTWTDELPFHSLFRGLPRVCAEFVMPLLPGAGVEVRHRAFDPQVSSAEWAGETPVPPQLRVAGISTTVANAFPMTFDSVTAEAVFCEGRGPLKVSVASKGGGMALTAVRKG